MKKLILAFVALCLVLPCHGEPVVALLSTNVLLFFDSGTPGTITRSVTVTGLQGGEMLIGMDYRLSNGGLYAVSTSSRLYKLNETTGAATAIGSAGGFTINSLSGGFIGLNFDPVDDRLRLITTNQNILINPDSGVVSSTDNPTDYDASDPHDLSAPSASAFAYTNNHAGAATTVLYGIDPKFDSLFTIHPPSSGNTFTLRPIGVDTGFREGFDISGVTGVAYACLSVSNVPTFYIINLGSGTPTNFGRISTAAFLGSATVNAITVPSPTRVLNLATRGLVGGGNGVLIGGFIARGAALTKLGIRAIGPSLSSFFPNALGNPKLEVFDTNGASLKINDDWKNGPPADQSELIVLGLQPTNDLESAMIVSLPAGQYTAVVSSSDPNNSGIGVVEIYQL